MVEGEGYEKVEKVDWNLKAEIGKQISELLQQVSISTIKGEFPLAFQHLKAIKLLFIFKLNGDERKKLRILEGLIEQRIPYYIMNINLQKQKRYYGNNPKVNSDEIKMLKEKLIKYPLQQIFYKYQIMIMDKMSLYGFLMGTKEDETEVGYD